jgi:hypothetical protein
MLAQKIALASTLVATLIAAAFPHQAKAATDTDLTSLKGITIGGGIGGTGPNARFVPWGGSVVLGDADAFMQSNGNCAFNLAYDMSNPGKAATAAAFKNKVFANGKVVSIQSNQKLAASTSKIVPTQAYLPSGSYELRLVLDSDNNLLESDEANNVRSIKVTSNALCGKAPPPKADLVSQKGIYIGGKALPWGASVTLKRENAILAANGKCAFNIGYDQANIGKTGSGVFNNTLSPGLTSLAQKPHISHIAVSVSV